MYDFNLKMIFDDKKACEKTILILILGLIISLKEKKITVDETEFILFSPYTMERLKENEIDNEIINLIIMGTEIEDVVSLKPDYYDEYLIKMEKKTIELINKKTEIKQMGKLIDKK